MKEIKINSWKDFEQRIRDIFQEGKELECDFCEVSTPLFRGQENADWPLDSSLDRIRKDFSVIEYLEKIRRIKSSIESCTANRWNLSDSKEEESRVFDKKYFSIEWYQYMAHLRHHGFPSPLLDWTRSPYVAAFFAFNNPKEKDVAIFTYMYLRDDGFGTGQFSPTSVEMVETGRYLTTHKRHHLQQCQYTFCIQDQDNGTQKRCFMSHEGKFNLKQSDQVGIEKYILPASLREQFLSQLNRMNINAYSLFDTEEGLMNKLSNEEFVIDRLTS